MTGCVKDIDGDRLFLFSVSHSHELPDSASAAKTVQSGQTPEMWPREDGKGMGPNSYFRVDLKNRLSSSDLTSNMAERCLCG